MNKLLEKTKKGQWVLVVVALILIYFGVGVGVVKDKIVAKKFFNKYSILTVSGEDSFSYSKIMINGETISKTDAGLGNILPIPGTLKYISMISSYMKGHSIPCGNKIIPKKVEQFHDGENEWCISNNGKEMVAISPAQYYPYDENNTVYESCLKDGYYEAIDGTSGYNSCAERGLFLNDKQIATTKEKMGKNYQSNALELQEASSFNYYPSKKLGSSIFYTTADGETYSYDTLTEKTSTIRIPDDYKPGLEDIFLTDKGEIILVEMGSAFNDKISTFLGEVTYNNQKYKDVYSAEYADSHFYVLRLTEIKKNNTTGLGSIITYELLKDGKKIANIETDSIAPYGYNENAIEQFPFCDQNQTIVCIYENGHYAYKNRTLVPEIYGDDFFTEEMVIDGEWRGDIIPNYIGHSKPIFENGKLKYIVYTDFLGKGLYLIDFDKKWNFKDLHFKKGSATTKILGGYQNTLLNVMEK